MNLFGCTFSHTDPQLLSITEEGHVKHHKKGGVTITCGAYACRGLFHYKCTKCGETWTEHVAWDAAEEVR